MRFVLLFASLSACSSSYATKEEVARLEGRIESLERSGAGSSTGLSQSASGQSGMGQSGMGQGGMGESGMGQSGQGGMSGQAGMSGQGGMGGEGGMGQGGMGQGGQGGMGQGGQGGQQQGSMTSDQLRALDESFSKALDASNSGDFATAKKTFLQIVKDYPDVPAATEAKNLAEELDAIGKKATEVSASSWIQGSGTVNTGNATLLVFFTPADKRAEDGWKRIETTAASYKARGLNVVGVVPGAVSAADATTWVKSKQVSFAVAQDNGTATASAYKRKSSLSGVLIKNGTVVWSGEPSRVPDPVLVSQLQ